MPLTGGARRHAGVLRPPGRHAVRRVRRGMLSFWPLPEAGPVPAVLSGCRGIPDYSGIERSLPDADAVLRIRGPLGLGPRLRGAAVGRPVGGRPGGAGRWRRSLGGAGVVVRGIPAVIRGGATAGAVPPGV